MKLLLYIGMLAVGTWGGFMSLSEMRARFFLEKVETRLNEAQLSVLSQSEWESILEDAREVSSITSAPVDAHVLYWRVARSYALQQQDRTKQMELFCESLAALNQALQLEPYNSSYLINWANGRQLLGDTPCPEAGTNGDFRAAIGLAAERDPTNPSVMYAAGLIHYWSGDKDRGAELFYQLLRYATSLSRGQKDVILQRIETAEDLRRIVPARFPQVQLWSSLFYQERPEDFRAFAPVFAELQAKALEKSAGEFQAGTIPAEIHFQRLLRIKDLAAHERVRRAIDRDLALYFKLQGDLDLAEHFERRSAFQEVEVVRGYRATDTRPERSSFHEWGSQRRVVFDAFHASLGFYVPKGEKVRLIEIQGAKRVALPSANKVKIFVSDDNARWREIVDGFEVRALEPPDEALLAIDVHHIDARYWKVHFFSSDREGKIKNALPELVRIYGYSRRAL